jgi:acetyl esterase/lipase
MRTTFGIGVPALILLCLPGCGQIHSDGPSGNSGSQDALPAADSYLARREHFKTALLKHGPSPQEWVNDPLPANVSRVEYMSDGRSLSAWLFRPERGNGEPRPALVYLHGGFAFGASDFTDCEPFVQAGCVVFCPTFRGENGNPGDFEMMLGEVDDAAEAVRWLARQEYVDPQAVFVFGHSSGGVLSAILSLYDALPAQHTGSAGGLYGPDLFDALSETVPFDRRDEREANMRVLIGNIRWMKRPHFAFVGTADRFMKGSTAEREAKAASTPLTVVELAGDHHSTLNPAMRRYLEVCQQTMAQTGQSPDKGP